MRYFFLLFVLLIACTSQVKESIAFDGQRIISDDSVSVYLKGSAYPVLGEFAKHTFTPVVPFQQGETYIAITRKDTLIFSIPADTTLSRPVLQATYPSCDTIPSNLLKVYLRFSQPMQEYRSSQFVFLYDDVTGDTVNDAFLDLKPELWNEDGTVLTMWIDPGRIKQDLIPNKELGTVLKDHHRYRLEVAKGWKSRKGVATNDVYSKTFITTTRDITRPAIKDLSITPGYDTIIVNTKETLDWALLTNKIALASKDLLEAETFSEVCERQLIIIPNKRLERGSYSIIIDAAIEDLAGNNFNRLFETDVTGQSKNLTNKEKYTLTFQVN